MRVRLVTPNGVETVLTCDKIIEIDGQPFTSMPEKQSEGELFQELKVAMLAIAQLGDHVDALAVRLNEVCEFLQQENTEDGGRPDHLVRDNDHLSVRVDRETA